jgi:hypothetical protein
MRLPPFSADVSASLATPATAVRRMLGKNAARAALMSALAAIRLASACRMSLRRSSSSDGKPAAMPGSCTEASGSVDTEKPCGARPSRTASAPTAPWRSSSMGGMLARTLAIRPCWRSISRAEIAPARN